jgi:hypothetical protein
MASSDEPKKPGARRSTVKPVRPGRDAVAGRPVAERDGYVTWEIPEELMQVLMEIGAHAFSKTGDDKEWSLNGGVYEALQLLVNGDGERAKNLHERLEKSYNRYAGLDRPPLRVFVLP